MSVETNNRLGEMIKRHLAEFGKVVISTVDEEGAEFKIVQYTNMAAGTSRLINQLARITNYRRVVSMAADDYTFHFKLTRDEA